MLNCHFSNFMEHDAVFKFITFTSHPVQKTAIAQKLELVYFHSFYSNMYWNDLLFFMKCLFLKLFIRNGSYKNRTFEFNKLVK